MNEYLSGRDVEAVDKTRAALRREIGPPTDRDDNWQPMISAGEVRQLLDALDEQAERIAQARVEAWDEAVQAMAWCLDNGPTESALPYVAEHNPHRAALRGDA